MDGSGRPQSLYVVVVRDGLRSPYFCSVLQLDLKPKSAKGFHLSIKGLSKGLSKSKLTSHSSLGRQLHQLDQNEYVAQFRRQLDHQKQYVAHFSLPKTPATHVPPTIRWAFTPLSDEELCLLPYLSSVDYRSDVTPLHAFTFNFTTNTYRRISPSKSSSNSGGCVVNLGGHIYYMPQPDAFFNLPKPLFERYDPVEDSWVTLKPFPLPPDVHKYRRILATVVWDDTILFNMGGHEIWAYNVTTDTWYPVTVKVEDGLCYRIVGEAAVLGNTIYALKDKSYNSVLALSIVKEEISGGDLVYACSLLSEISVPGIQRISSTDGDAIWETRYLVYLGKDDFCLVQSCMLDCFPAEYQPIQLTCMKLEGLTMTVISNRVHKLPIVDNQEFKVRFCFSLPECKFPPASVKQTDRFFDIDPFPVGFDISQILYSTPYNLETGELVIPSLKDNFSSQTNIIHKQGGSKSRDPRSTHEMIHPQVAAKSNVDASSSKTVEGGGGLQYKGRPLDSYTLREKVVIIDRWREQIRQMDISSSGKKNSPDDTLT